VGCGFLAGLPHMSMSGARISLYCWGFSGDGRARSARIERMGATVAVLPDEVAAWVACAPRSVAASAAGRCGGRVAVARRQARPGSGTGSARRVCGPGAGPHVGESRCGAGGAAPGRSSRTGCPAPSACWARGRADRRTPGRLPTRCCAPGWTPGGQPAGDTTNTSLHVLCRRHRKTKHEASWRVHRRPDGSTHWTSPIGRRYTKPRATHPLDHTRPKIRDDPPPYCLTVRRTGAYPPGKALPLRQDSEGRASCAEPRS
jgi:hypothetical protein